MESENALIQQSFGALAHFHGSPTGLEFERDFADLDEFKSYCESLAKVRSFGPFAVGDGFLKAVAQFGEKKAMGDTLIEITGHTPAWVRKCTEVAKAIPYQYRRMTGRWMSFEHHAAAAKVKSPGCLDNHPGVVGGYEGCDGCVTARLETIANWLETAEKKHWSAKELKDQIASKMTTVREHQRNLSGKEFNAEAFGEIVNSARASCGNLYDALTVKNLLNKKKDGIDRTATKSLMSKIEEAREELEAVEEAIKHEVEA